MIPLPLHVVNLGDTSHSEYRRQPELPIPVPDGIQFNMQRRSAQVFAVAKKFQTHLHGLIQKTVPLEEEYAKAKAKTRPKMEVALFADVIEEKSGGGDENSLWSDGITMETNADELQVAQTAQAMNATLKLHENLPQQHSDLSLSFEVIGEKEVQEAAHQHQQNDWLEKEKVDDLTSDPSASSLWEPVNIPQLQQQNPVPKQVLNVDSFIERNPICFFSKKSSIVKNHLFSIRRLRPSPPPISHMQMIMITDVKNVCLFRSILMVNQ